MMKLSFSFMMSRICLTAGSLQCEWGGHRLGDYFCFFFFLIWKNGSDHVRRTPKQVLSETVGIERKRKKPLIALIPLGSQRCYELGILHFRTGGTIAI